MIIHQNLNLQEKIEVEAGLVAKIVEREEKEVAAEAIAEVAEVEAVVRVEVGVLAEVEAEAGVEVLNQNLQQCWEYLDFQQVQGRKILTKSLQDSGN